MKSERYFILILTILLYTNLAAHFMSQMEPRTTTKPPTEHVAPPGERGITTSFVPPFRPRIGRRCRKVEDVSVYEPGPSTKTGKAPNQLVGKEKKETWINCP